MSKKMVFSTCLVLLALIYVSGGLNFAFNSLFNHNINIVVPGKLIRSAQLKRSDLKKVIGEYEIKTVIDLRLDEDAPDASGTSEKEVSTEAGAIYIHAPLSSKTVIQYARILAVFSAIKTATPPVLVHCSDGVHRSGFFSALWLMMRENADKSTVLNQLTFKYGFIALERRLKEVIGNTRTLDRLISDYYETKKDNQDFEMWYLAEHKL